MNMNVEEKIKAENLLSLVYSLSDAACAYHGLPSDEVGELTLNMFTEFLEEKAKKKESFLLLVSD